MTAKAIQTHDLSVYYGEHRGIHRVNLAVEPGEVFGFLGPNGSGKTTTQRVLLDIIHPTAGRASVFGMDTRQHAVEIRRRVGYLPGELRLYANMTADAFLDMLSAMREKTLDRSYRRQLIERLELDPTRRIQQYSRGNKQKVGIVAAFMSRPDLLILDEPTGGLDPLVQQTVLHMVDEVRAEGRTVFFSSHILPEVQQVCDRVGIIREGQLVRTERVETLMEQHFKRLHITFQQMPPMDAFSLPDVSETERDDAAVTLEVRDGLPQVMSIAAQYGITDIETTPVSLEEAFLAFYDHKQTPEREVQHA